MKTIYLFLSIVIFVELINRELIVIQSICVLVDHIEIGCMIPSNTINIYFSIVYLWGFVLGGLKIILKTRYLSIFV